MDTSFLENTFHLEIISSLMMALIFLIFTPIIERTWYFPSKKKTRMHYLAPPFDFKPAEMRMFLKGKATAKEMMATIIDLHSQKLITINKNSIITLNPDEIRAKIATLNKHEKLVLEKMIEIDGKKMDKNTFKDFFYGFQYTFYKAVSRDLDEHNLYFISPAMVRDSGGKKGEYIMQKFGWKFFLIYAVLFFLQLYILDNPDFMPLKAMQVAFAFVTFIKILFFSLILFIVLYMVFGFSAPHFFAMKNATGRKILYEIIGFKTYIKTAEKDRLLASTLKERYKYAGYGFVFDIYSKDYKPLYNIIDYIDTHRAALKRGIPWKIIFGVIFAYIGLIWIVRGLTAFMSFITDLVG